VTVALDAQVYPPTDALVAIVAGRAVARSDTEPSDGDDHDSGTWTAYTAQQVGPGRWEYVAESFSRV
jgi:hypothetical protein